MPTTNTRPSAVLCVASLQMTRRHPQIPTVTTTADADAIYHLNWGFRRFTLRGIEKVAHEWRLLMMGHNIRKLARKITGAAANPAPAAAIA